MSKSMFPEFITGIGRLAPKPFTGSEKRAGHRMKLPLPFRAVIDGEERSAFCTDITRDSLGVSINGEPPAIGQEIHVHMWLAGKKLDAKAWVLRSGRTVGLRCPEAFRIYEVLKH